MELGETDKKISQQYQFISGTVSGTYIRLTSDNLQLGK